MNTAVFESRQWSRGRWWLIVALIFAAHIGLIFAFGERKPLVPRQPAFTPELRLGANRTELLALDDPTLFALPHANGFSGAAWMRIPRVEPEPFQWTEPPRWLPMPVEQLGAVFSQFMRTNEFTRFLPESKSAPQLAVPDIAPVENTSAAKSVLRIEGDLALRTLVNPPLLPSWPGSDLLASSEVQVLVDAAGNVISVSLLPPGSGSKEADQRALTLAKPAKFAAVAREIGSATKPVNQWTRGKMIFQWRTEPLPLTNAPPSSP